MNDEELHNALMEIKEAIERIDNTLQKPQDTQDYYLQLPFSYNINAGYLLLFGPVLASALLLLVVYVMTEGLF